MLVRVSFLFIVQFMTVTCELRLTNCLEARQHSIELFRKKVYPE